MTPVTDSYVLSLGDDMIKCSECNRDDHDNCVMKPRADGRRFRAFCQCDHAGAGAGAAKTVVLALADATITVTGPAAAVAAVVGDLRGMGAE